jgi:hypothetical protein
MSHLLGATTRRSSRSLRAPPSAGGFRIGYSAAGFPKEDAVVGLGIKRWVEINEIDALVQKLSNRFVFSSADRARGLNAFACSFPEDFHEHDEKRNRAHCEGEFFFRITSAERWQ